ncbi:MAG: Putative extracellular protein [Candidatus Tokpelaia hoelldobleri]|uniref:Extracellular protein n=1 Tax=Candidatus Tokpelaia hoelldobleri TaxID=1902579 RepID=A0A1U9JVM0_9HYPH|nr:MAG: Putative extracellular protein [Candidatus Tokpelaia hoelldoblerii]
MFFKSLQGTEVEAGGFSTASMTEKQSFVVHVSVANVANYVRWGNDLIIELNDGKTVRVNNFFVNGAGFHALLLAGGGSQLLVDFSQAMTSEGDGINDSVVRYHGVDESSSGKTLLSILGGAAALGGIAAAVSSGGGGGHSGGEEKVYPGIPGDYTIEDNVDGDEDDDLVDITGKEDIRDNTPTFKGEYLPPKGSDAPKAATVFFTFQQVKYDEDNPDKEPEKIGEPITREVTVDKDGNWALTEDDWDGDVLADGDWDITVVMKDKDGNIIGKDTGTVTVDTKPPAVPELLEVSDVKGPDPITVDEDGNIRDAQKKGTIDKDHGVIEDGGVTNSAQLEFHGKGEAGLTVRLYYKDPVTGKDVLAGSATVNKKGEWMLKPDKALKDGDYEFEIRQVSKAGKESEDNNPGFKVEIDNTKPVFDLTSVELTQNDGEPIKLPDYNNQSRIVDIDDLEGLVFKGEFAMKDVQWVKVYDLSADPNKTEAPLAIVKVVDGKWEWDMSGLNLSRGGHRLQFTAVDRAGNEGDLQDFNGSSSSRDIVIRIDYQPKAASGGDGKDENNTGDDNDKNTGDGKDESNTGDGSQSPEDSRAPDDSQEPVKGAVDDNQTDAEALPYHSGDTFSAIGYGSGAEDAANYALDSITQPMGEGKAAVSSLQAPFHWMDDGGNAAGFGGQDNLPALAYGADEAVNLWNGFENPAYEDAAVIQTADEPAVSVENADSHAEVAVADAEHHAVDADDATGGGGDLPNDLQISDLLYQDGAQAGLAETDVSLPFDLPFGQWGMDDIEQAALHAQVLV